MPLVLSTGAKYFFRGLARTFSFGKPIRSDNLPNHWLSVEQHVRADIHQGITEVVAAQNDPVLSGRIAAMLAAHQSTDNQTVPQLLAQLEEYRKGLGVAAMERAEQIGIERDEAIHRDILRIRLRWERRRPKGA